MDRPATSLTEAIYHDVRARLMAGEFTPDEKVKIADLSQQLGVSPSVIREVMARLASEGLLIAEPQRGFRVAPLQLSDLRSLTDARIEIESLCLTESIKHGDLTWESRIVSALHTLNRTPSEENADSHRIASHWAGAHSDFHRALVSACPNPWYLKMREMLYMHSERYRALAIQASRAPRDLQTEHTELAEVTIGRDAKRACRLMAEHLDRTTTILIKSIPAAPIAPPVPKEAKEAQKTAHA